MNSNFKTAMLEATRLTRIGKLADATAAIRRALSGRTDPGAAAAENNHAPADGAHNGPHIWDAAPVRPGSNEFAVPGGPDTQVGVAAAEADAAHHTAEVRPAFREADVAPEPFDGVDDFADGVYKHALQTLHYKLYSPPNHAQHGLALVVMLHGCTQDPDDFAAGTRMNERAREQGFFVLYPAQPAGANPSKCWNWFKPVHQHRDSGEPAMIAGATLEIIREHGIDASRVYIAGLSAGGAMATIVANAYPDIFAAAGVHSGLVRGAASNVIDALSVMKRPRSLFSPSAGEHPPVPTIIIHGDEDQTVHPQNSEQVLAAALHTSNATATTAGPQIEQGESRGGRKFTRSVYRDTAGNVQAEHWLIHGGGHAWAGGDTAGSHTDASGPDASRAILDFFFAQPGSQLRN
ncbi:MAG: PHB depolymerase family esterase [Betaproteobacteria bacterium]